ncbi:MAG: ACP S-malonyltransferase [Chlamydiales bacterium]
MTKSLAYLFPGQGAQYVGMGADFLQAYPIARQTVEEAEDTLGIKLRKLMLDGPIEVLTETHNSQIAIYVLSMAILGVIEDQFPSIMPSVCSGLSLGEYSALTASGKLSYSKTLPIVYSRGIYMSEACEHHKGGMAVILGLSPSTVEKAVQDAQLPNDLWVANLNTPTQVVVSGTKKGIEYAEKKFKELGAKRVLPLQVHGAFHSGLMAEAEKRLRPQVESLPILNSEILLVMNVTGGLVREVAQIRENLIKQVTHPVRWEQGIATCLNLGVSHFIEIGCGKTLKGLNRGIGVPIETLSIEKVEDLKQLEALGG